MPVIVSTTLDDAAFGRTDFDLDEAGLRNEVTRIAPGTVDEVVAAYRRAFPTSSPFLLLGKMRTDRGTRRYAYLLADRKAALHRAHTYMYLLEFPSPAYGGKFGAVHATDVPLVFHNIEGQRMTGNSSESRRVADQMAGMRRLREHWQPEPCGDSHLACLHADQQQTMIFNQTSHVENAPWTELRAMWSEVEPAADEFVRGVGAKPVSALARFPGIHWSVAGPAPVARRPRLA